MKKTTLLAAVSLVLLGQTVAQKNQKENQGNMEKALQQLYILPNTAKGIVQGMQAVTEKEYHAGN